jgi:hypothetical protein
MARSIRGRNDRPGDTESRLFRSEGFDLGPEQHKESATALRRHSGLCGPGIEITGGYRAADDSAVLIVHFEMNVVAIKPKFGVFPVAQWHGRASPFNSVGNAASRVLFLTIGYAMAREIRCPGEEVYAPPRPSVHQRQGMALTTNDKHAKLALNKAPRDLDELFSE